MDIINSFSAKFSEWLDLFLESLPALVTAVAIVVVFALLGRLVRRMTRVGINRVANNEQVANLAGSIFYIAVLSTGLFIALGVLDLDKTVTAMLAGVGVIGLALGFAFQDIAANFMSGIFLAFRKPFDIGDVVETNGITGVVDEMNLRSTVIMTATGQSVMVPNKMVFESPIKNFNTYKRRRIDLAVGVSYGDDLDKAKRVTLAAVANVAGQEKGSDPVLFYTGFGGSSIDLVVQIWVPFSKPSDYWSAQSDAIMKIKDAFDANNITIPFPIRTLDFGIVGGENLASMLPKRN